jgi:nitroreductase
LIFNLYHTILPIVKVKYQEIDGGIMMNVTQALNARRSIRAFLPDQVEKEKLTAVLEAAVHTPSWGNSQPWEVFIAAGDTLDRIKNEYKKKYADKAPAVQEIPHPLEWPEAVKKRQKRLRPDMVRDCGDAAEQFGLLNQTLFNAPTVIYICMDRILSPWSLYDIGAYSQSLMLAAIEQGLSTIPAIMLVHYSDVLRRELKISDNLKIVMGIAIGYADKENKINNFVSGRSPLSETVHFLD